MPEPCIFCAVSPEEAWIQTEFVVALPHPQPAGACHVVVAPRRHVSAFYDLDVQEQALLWAVVQELRKRISAALRTEGFDVGFADGDGAWHTHVHVIPRVQGASRALPRGIQWVNLDDDASAQTTRT